MTFTLFLLGILVAALAFQLARVRRELVSLKSLLAALLDAQVDQRRHEAGQTQLSLEAICGQLSEVHSELVEIRQTTDVIYKYKLPNKSERDFLDQMEIDNEVFDGVASGGMKKSDA